MEKDKVQFEHCKMTVIGNVDSGKSTLVGVLTKAIPDDGRGSARLRVFNYPHEIQTGRYSIFYSEQVLSVMKLWDLTKRETKLFQIVSR